MLNGIGDGLRGYTVICVCYESLGPVSQDLTIPEA